MHKIWIASFISLLFANAVVAHPLSGNVAVHIAKRHYEHPVRMLHPYLDVWHMKGPMIEKVQLKVLPKHFENIKMCANSSNADVVLSIEPQMFYNAQLRVFHAEIIAKAYVNTGVPIDQLVAIATVKKQAQQNGELGIKPDYYMEKAYTKAMEKMIKQLETDSVFLAVLNKTPTNKAETLCAGLDNLPVSKIYY
ncbi:MAG: hypothetical protein H7Z20_01265 [Bdellovibrio sp.]|nr:hypothetical protein [Methylotenera sp.]